MTLHWIVISISLKPVSLNAVSLGIEFGAACTLSHMGAVLRAALETLPPHQTEVFLAVLEQLRWFAGLQIRNVAVSHTPPNKTLKSVSTTDRISG